MKFIHRKNILYISYDGLTDPLGQSQILPYILGLSKENYRFTILSFEKKEKFLEEKANIEQLIEPSNIIWVPLSFTRKPPLLAKLYDAFRMRRKAFSLHKKMKFDMVHCRSYAAADVGLQMKKKWGIKFFFDMRGFWADEKKDGGRWNLANPIFKAVYKYYKKREVQYLQNADYIILLTEAGKKELMRWPSYNKAIPLEIIPCCADMDHFSLTNEQAKQEARKMLKIGEDSFVISYLGSVGTWYMLEEMLLFFKQLKKKYSHAKFLFLTHSDPFLIYSKTAALELDKDDFIITEASYKRVPELLKASDINISFIKPVYSKISSSPTKLGEVLSMGIPVIVNSGVGDVESIIERIQGGYVLKKFSENEFADAIKALPELKRKDPRSIRQKTELVYDLQKGIELYRKCYNELFYSYQNH